MCILFPALLIAADSYHMLCLNSSTAAVVEADPISHTLVVDDDSELGLPVSEAQPGTL